MPGRGERAYGYNVHTRVQAEKETETGPEIVRSRVRHIIRKVIKAAGLIFRKCKRAHTVDTIAFAAKSAVARSVSGRG